MSTAVISGAQLIYISNLYHCICTKPLLQVKFTYRQKSLRENIRLLSNSVCLVIYCYQGISCKCTQKDICKQVTMTSGLKHIFCLYTRLHAPWLLETEVLYLLQRRQLIINQRWHDWVCATSYSIAGVKTNQTLKRNVQRWETYIYKNVHIWQRLYSK